MCPVLKCCGNDAYFFYVGTLWSHSCVLYSHLQLPVHSCHICTCGYFFLGGSVTYTCGNRVLRLHDVVFVCMVTGGTMVTFVVLCVSVSVISDLTHRATPIDFSSTIVAECM